MNSRIVNNNIQEMIERSCPANEVFDYVKNECQQELLTPKTLGMLFELYAGLNKMNDESSYYSEDIKISDLKNIHPGFESSNGCQWARSDGSYLGKKYIINRTLDRNKVVSVRLNGPNDSLKRFRSIRSDIRKVLLKRNCAILDVGNNIEIDHKNGRYNDSSLSDLSLQEESDFQPLSKAANDAKRQHCKVCIQTSKRYDARNLGYSVGWISGDENTNGCCGCYWYDPYEFNKIISEDFTL